MQVSIFGNPDLEIDSMPVRLLPFLKKSLPETEFIHQDPNENVSPPAGQVWWIIDTIQGINKPALITNFDQLKVERRVSMHDYDLAMELALIKKINPKLKIRIIGVPATGDLEQITQAVVSLLTS